MKLDVMERYPREVVFENAEQGLGLKLMGGRNSASTACEKTVGIFVRQIIAGGLVASSRSMNIGNEILAVNGTSLKDSTCSRAVNLLRQASASGYVALTVASDDQAREGYASLIASSRTKAEKKLMSTVKGTANSPVSEDIRPCSEVPVPNERRVCIQKTSAGLGLCLREEQCQHHTSQLQVSVLRVASLSARGDVAQSDSLRVDDVITALNHHPLTHLTLDQAHSLLLREKLSTNPTITISYLPSSASDVCSAIHPRSVGTEDRLQPRKDSETNQHSGGKPSRRVDDAREAVRHELKALFEKNFDKKQKMNGGGSGSPEQDVAQPTLKPLHSKLMLTDDYRIKVGKLHEALEHLGVDANDDKLQLLHRRLGVDSDQDSAKYGDFVAAILEIFDVELRAVNGSTPETDDRTTSSVRDAEEGEIAQLREETRELRARVALLSDENRELRAQLTSERSVRQRDSREVALSNRDQQRLVDGMKRDYDDVIRALESELAALKSSEQSMTTMDDVVDDDDGGEKARSLLECECRKLNEARVECEEKVETLLQFVNKVVQSDVKEFAKHQKTTEAIETLERLASEAEYLYLNVRSQMQHDDLPYGWERASLSDGRCYYIDHVNHLTSWTDPRETAATQPAPRNSNEKDGNRQQQQVANRTSTSTTGSSQDDFRFKTRLV